MKFSWNKYEEVALSKRNTMQVFITNRCNLDCPGCFAAKMRQLGTKQDMTLREYCALVDRAMDKGAKQINILGGEPYLHSRLSRFCKANEVRGLKTTIYTNGTMLSKMNMDSLCGAKVRVSIYGPGIGIKGVGSLDSQEFDYSIDANYMVGASTSYLDLVHTANYVESRFDCEVFFISSIRECDNDNDFFNDTKRTMPVLLYKKLVHWFLEDYKGYMEIHISKRGVFESTLSLPHNRCKFVNCFIGGGIIQCPYDVVNMKFQEDYHFDTRYCQQNNTCLMSKIIVRRKR